MTAAIPILQTFYRFEPEHRLNLVDSELADTVILFHYGIPGGIGGEEPLVIISAIRTVDHAKGVRLEDPGSGKQAGPWNDIGLITGRKLHTDAKRNELEFPGGKLHRFRSAEIDPISNRDLFELNQLRVVVLDFDFDMNSSYSQNE